MRLGLRFFRALAGGTDSPVNDFGLVNSEAVIFCRVEAGCLADGAINIVRFEATTANEMVVIVADAVFKERR